LTYVDSGIAVAYDGDEKVIGLGTSYDFGVLKAFAQYTQIKQTADTVTPNVANKDRIYQVGVSVPVTEKGSILASYGKEMNKLEAGGAKESDTVVSVGYDYFLSKRTDVYAVFSNNQHTDLKSGQTFAVGIKHAF
jgi:predicted porin